MWYNGYFGCLPIAEIANLSPKKLAKFQSNIEFQNTFQNLMTTALNIFKWDGLPDTCDEKMLERSLILTGRAVMEKTEQGYLTLAASAASGVNLYGYPVRAHAYGMNGYNHEVVLYVPGADTDKKLVKAAGEPVSNLTYNAVMCYDNAEGFPFVKYLITASERMSNAMRTMDVTVQNLKQPMVITCDEAMVNTVKEVLNNKDANVTAIIGNSKLPVDSFKVWQTGCDASILQSLREHYEWVANQTKSIMGINSNENLDKRERLLVDEVNANNQSIEESVDKRLAWRRKFCNEVNDAFGLNISVSLRNPIGGNCDVTVDVDERRRAFDRTGDSSGMRNYDAD